MAKDILFMLHPDFADPKAGPGAYFCPSCAFVEGVLSYYPQLREAVEVRKVAFPRPRPAIIELVGEENQGCPVLILAGEPDPAATTVPTKRRNGRYFINDPKDIAEYLGLVHGAGRPHP